MKNDYRMDLLVQVARLYYEHGYNQNQIAQKLNISRPYISKILDEARKAGIVEIKVHDPNQTETPLEKKIRTRFNLLKAIAVPASMEENDLVCVGRAAAKYLGTAVQAGDVIGVSWGNTLYATAQLLQKKSTVSDVVVMQLCGGSSCLKTDSYATEIVKEFAEAFGGQPYMLPLPAVIDNVETKERILQDQYIAEAVNYWEKANKVVFTMGAFGEHNALVKIGYLDHDEMNQLSKAGAVGDICSHIINGQGEICDKLLDDRTIAIPLEQIKKKEQRIAVVTGMHKIDCICAALKNSFVNVLISDEPTMEGVLQRLDEEK